MNPGTIERAASRLLPGDTLRRGGKTWRVLSVVIEGAEVEVTCQHEHTGVPATFCLIADEIVFCGPAPRAARS